MSRGVVWSQFWGWKIWYGGEVHWGISWSFCNGQAFISSNLNILSLFTIGTKYFEPEILFSLLGNSMNSMLKTYGLSGQQTPGTNRDLKQMEPLNILRFTKSNGQSWISWHLPLPPWEVVQEGESLGDLLVTWSPPPWKFPPCLPCDLSPPPPLIAPPIALTPAPSRPSPWVNWAATGSSRLVTFVPRTFLPTTRGKVLKLAMGANN